MLDRLNRSDSSRMRPDLEAAIEYLPGLASLALWCRFADTDEADAIAFTDGSTIYAGAEYEKFEPKERRFICLHEILHIALCHPQRFAELEKRDPANFDAKLLNIAADSVINTSLENLTALETPNDAWTLSRIWQCLEKSEDAKNPPVAAGANKGAPVYSFNIPARAERKIANLTKADFVRVNRWSCEELYYFLKSRCQTESRFYGFLLEFNDRDALAGDLRVEKSDADKKCEPIATQISAGGDEEKRNWQQRLTLLRGSVPELLERLAAELPRVETPWEQIFRSVVQTAFQEATQKNYSRPNRRWLALEKDYRAQTGIDLPFSPDAIKKRGTRLAVALDTSGSIDGELLSRFLAEIAAMCAFNQRNLVLLIGDAAVHQIVEIDWMQVSNELSEIKYTGGGGTDFRPLIKAAAEFEPDALVYLTDLYGETGDEPNFPVIWATHGIAGDSPWGEQIKLK